MLKRSAAGEMCDSLFVSFDCFESIGGRPHVYRAAAKSAGQVSPAPNVSHTHTNLCTHSCCHLLSLLVWDAMSTKQ